MLDLVAFRICIDARKIADFGIGSYVRNLVTSLAEIDPDNHYQLLVGEADRALLGGLPENFQTTIDASPGYSLREQISISRHLLELRPDLFHSPHYVLPSRLPCPTVVTIHDVIHLLYPQFLPNRIASYYARFMIRRSLLRGQRVVAVSETTRNDLQTLFPKIANHIAVVRNGVDPIFHRLPTTAELDDCLSRLGVALPYLLFVGNPKPHKNLEGLLRAYAAAITTSDIEENLTCVGDRGNHSDELRRLCSTLEIGDRVQLIGHVSRSDLACLYRAASLLLFPSLYEGFGLPVVEAMASATPVLASDVPAVREVAGNAADFFDPNDVDTMKTALLRLLGDPERQAELVTRGLERAREFSWQQCARQTLAIYRSAVEEASETRGRYHGSN